MIADHFDLARRKFRVCSAGRTLTYFSTRVNDKFGAKSPRSFVSLCPTLGSRRIEHELGHAVPITKVDENQPTMIPAF